MRTLVIGIGLLGFIACGGGPDLRPNTPGEPGAAAAEAPKVDTVGSVNDELSHATSASAIPAGAQTLPEPPVAVASVDSFKEPLAQFGKWSDHAEHGQVWTPDPATVGAKWKPYTKGKWELTEYGWTWVSGMPWGWGPEHYGRWTKVGESWSWVPDTVWGPAWVNWRESEKHFAWAPLPPATDAGSEDATTEASDFNAVPAENFQEEDVAEKLVSPEQLAELWQNLQPVGRYGAIGNVAVSTGPRVDVVARAVRTPVAARVLLTSPSSARMVAPVHLRARIGISPYRNPALRARAFAQSPRYGTVAARMRHIPPRPAPRMVQRPVPVHRPVAAAAHRPTVGTRPVSRAPSGFNASRPVHTPTHAAPRPAVSRPAVSRPVSRPRVAAPRRVVPAPVVRPRVHVPAPRVVPRFNFRR